MKEQPEALRLADELDGMPVNEFYEALGDEAAAELRRLHEAHDWQYRMAGERLRRIEKLEAQRDALLKALKKIAADHAYFSGDTLSYARAAIAKAEEKT